MAEEGRGRVREDGWKKIEGERKRERERGREE